MPSATVTSKGQITIPKDIREYLELHPGDNVDFVVEEDGRVVMKQATLDIRELDGMLRRPGGKRVSVAQMDRVIRERAGKRK